MLYFRPARRAATPRSSTPTRATASSGSASGPSLEEIEAELGARGPAPRRAARGHQEGPRRRSSCASSGTPTPSSTAVLDEARAESAEREARGRRGAATTSCSPMLSELRLIKDEYEIEQMRLACAATAEGFEDVVRSLPDAVGTGRGERWVEGSFGLVARHAGNGVGYDTIAAAGDHACTLHWIRNDGDGPRRRPAAGRRRRRGRLALHRRRHPHAAGQRPLHRGAAPGLRGRARRRRRPAMAAVKPGRHVPRLHDAAIKVIAERLARVGAAAGRRRDRRWTTEGSYHRRWMVHGTSHHLGLDVHDCAQARARCTWTACSSRAWSSPSSPACTSRPTT